MADDETTTPDEAPPMTDAPPTADAAAEGQLDLSQIRVETLMLQVASELLSIGAGQLGMVPEMINGGDAVQASLAITGADALIQAFLLVLPEGGPWGNSPIFVVPSGGVRLLANRYSIDLGVVPILAIDRGLPVIPVPWVSFDWAW